ncbi:MAG: glycoside hydrolase family 88 protein [Rikenellaceae bacterium]
MKPIFLFLLSLLVISCQKSNFDPDTIVRNMERVAAYELANPSHHYAEDDPYNYPNGWVPSTFYISLIPLYEATQDSQYIDAVKAWGDKFDWSCAPRLRHADDIVCGQIFLDLYRHDGKERYIAPLLERMQTIMASEIPGREDWYWCDALFMAPPVYAMAGKIFNDDAYYQFNERMYWDVHDYLFDTQESLFYRDRRYFTAKSPNGEKLFWGRGNGWIMGGLARMIPYIKDKASKDRYIDLFKTMASRVIELQQPDGMWRSNLLDPNDYAQKETSASAFYIYALAWGLNNGLLDAQTYLPVVERGWDALCDCIDPESGMLGWVQPIGAAPGDTKASTTMSYGVGAYILAGTEILKFENVN